MEISSGQISMSKKRKDCPEIDGGDDDDEPEEEKMNKFYELIRSFRDARHDLVFNSNTMSKNSETANQQLAEKIEHKKINKTKKKKKTDKEKEAAVAISCTEHQTNELLGSNGTALGVNLSDKHQGLISGDQNRDDTQGLDLNLSL